MREDAEALSRPGGESMASKWAVLVIHGVGDSKPGVTVDAFVPTLAAARPGHLCPDGRVEFAGFAPTAAHPEAGPPQQARLQKVELFPVHIRCAAVTAGAGSPSEAVFAEVYSADLSGSGRGCCKASSL